ncbi:class I SAM-dependent methyltransferase [Methylosinus sp. PW1]|uniref:class I SAM-dependent methyltransferase n=1 Tax=Methylosinus sp. PW1 TaxID=107636 RepID=UPI0009FC674B|nr:class I SAM-dependent methyltransferase [Methylosinus sp. PW1]
MSGRHFDHASANNEWGNFATNRYHYDVVRNTGKESFSEEFLRHLRELNKIVISHECHFEGSNFYCNGTKLEGELLPNESLASARRNIWRAARFKKSVLEIGVNAGHTALLVLMSSPFVKYTGVDICLNPYVTGCANYLMQQFPDRFRFLQGDSREVLPALSNSSSRGSFDLFHVDGGHSVEICRDDLNNVLLLADGARSHLILDDINAEWIFDLYAEFVLNGPLQTENLSGDWEDTNRHILARILP